MNIKIDYLKNHPESISALAQIWYEVLGSIWMPDTPIKVAEQRFHDQLNDSTLPITLVALDGTQPIGSVTLCENDGIGDDLTPWLGTLMIDKSYQNRGVGRLLVEKLKQKALSLNFKSLHLFAFDPALIPYYEHLGFKTIGEDKYKAHNVTVMKALL